MCQETVDQKRVSPVHDIFIMREAGREGEVGKRKKVQQATERERKKVRTSSEVRHSKSELNHKYVVAENGLRLREKLDFKGKLPELSSDEKEEIKKLSPQAYNGIKIGTILRDDKLRRAKLSRTRWRKLCSAGLC